MHRPYSRSIWLITFFANLVICAIVTSAEPEPGSATDALGTDDLQPLVDGLAAPAFTTRMRSRNRLIELASSDQAMGLRIQVALRENPLPPSDLELFLAKQSLLRQLVQTDREILMERFLYDSTLDERNVQGWNSFRELAGDSLDARLVFVAAIKDRPEIGKLLSVASDPSVPTPDIDRVEPQDLGGWSVLLSKACQHRSTVADANSMRLVAALRNPGSGPVGIRDHEQRVVSRMVESFLTLASVDVRDRIVIGIRYECDRITEECCRDVLSRPGESASRTVTALLAASALNFSPIEIDRWIAEGRHDDRVSHVWRSLTPPQSTHRTQVRDVAYALALHRAGIDPRTRGFSVIVADPMLVFRPHSLGFESEESRQLAHRAESASAP